MLYAISYKSKLSYKPCLWYSFISDITLSLSFSVPILSSLWKNFFKVCKILCKKLCNKLGIGIELNSVQNEGTEVMLIFPQSSYVELK